LKTVFFSAGRSSAKFALASFSSCPFSPWLMKGLYFGAAAIMLNFINAGNFHGFLAYSSSTLSHNLLLWITNRFSAFQLLYDIVLLFCCRISEQISPFFPAKNKKTFIYRYPYARSQDKRQRNLPCQNISVAEKKSNYE